MVVGSIPGRRAIGRLVLGWVTVFGRAYHMAPRHVTCHLGQLSLLPSVGRETSRPAKVR